jgi:medium-chain acyl-[acyl-carrier-protein] hydrolase
MVSIPKASRPLRNPWILDGSITVPPLLSLFCFPSAGAGASVFRSWMRRFPRGRHVCAIQLPGREERANEPALTDMEKLSEQVEQEVRPYTRRPFAFFGHSMGAILAFEVARRLQKTAAATPEILIVTACPAPQLERDEVQSHQLDDSELRMELKKLEGTPAEILEDSELMQSLLPQIRADFQVVQTYKYCSGERLRCPILAIAGADDQEVSEAEMNAWRVQTSRDFFFCVLPGNHFLPINSPESVISTILKYMPSV